MATKKLSIETPDSPIMLAELEERIITLLREEGITEPTRDTIGRIGTPIFKARKVCYYTEIWGGKDPKTGASHRWLSKAVLKRITAACKADQDQDGDQG